MAKRGRPKKVAKIARQARLPQMDDPKIEALHNAALDYVEIRDARQELTAKEVKLQAKLLTIMKEHGKKTYHYNGVDCKLVVEKEKVKVRVKKDKEGE